METGQEHNDPATETEKGDNGQREHRAPIIEHLSELRKRIMISLLSIIALMSIALWQSDLIVGWLRAPLDNVRQEAADKAAKLAEQNGEDFNAELAVPPAMLISLKPIEVFMAVLKMCFFLTLFLALPIILYQIWAFIKIGLKENEGAAILPTLFACPVMFIGGVLFGYYLVLEFALGFFVEFSAAYGVQSAWNFDAYLSFVSWFLIGFGLVFEMPLVIIALAKMGLVTHSFLNRNRRYAIVIIFALAAIITPTTDPWTMTLMAIPMWALYEISVLWVYFAHRKKNKQKKQKEA